MKKRFALAVTLALAALLVFAAAASAQEGDDELPPPAPLQDAADLGARDLPGGGWWSGITVVNIGTGDATVIMTLYDMNSTNTYDSVAKTIASGASYNFSPLNSADWSTQPPAGFIGSAVVSADQPILAMVNEQNNLVSGGVAGASYRGFTSDQTATRLLFPLVKQNYGSTNKTTTFFIQNASGSSADVYATFRVGASTYSHIYSSVGPNELQIVNPSDAGVPSGSLGSLEITSTVELAGIYNEHPHSTTLAETLLGTIGFTPAMADERLFVPLFKQNYNTAYSGVSVMNAGDVAATVYATYTVSYGGSGTYYEQLSADAGESVNFFAVSGWPGDTYGTLTVSAAQPLVAVSNETKYSTGQSAVYAAFAESGVTNCAVAPLWKTRWSGKSSGQQSAITVQNVGSVAATVNITFTMTTGATGTFTPPARVVDPGEGTNYGPGPFTGGPDFNSPATGAVEICATQPIAVLVQETTLPGWATRDLLNYEAFNK